MQQCCSFKVEERHFSRALRGEARLLMLASQNLNLCKPPIVVLYRVVCICIGYIVTLSLSSLTLLLFCLYIYISLSPSLRYDIRTSWYDDLPRDVTTFNESMSMRHVAQNIQEKKKTLKITCRLKISYLMFNVIYVIRGSTFLYASVSSIISSQ